MSVEFFFSKEQKKYFSPNFKCELKSDVKSLMYFISN